MPVERTEAGASLIDVLDRVLDKGIVIDAWLRLSLVGVNLLTLEARVIVASIETYLKHSEVIAQVPPSLPTAEVARPSEDGVPEDVRPSPRMSQGPSGRLRRPRAIGRATAAKSHRHRR